MTQEEKICAAIAALGKGKVKTFVAVVENNYPDKDYVDVKDMSGTLYIGVRKRAAIKESDAGIVITPVAGSSVIVSRIQDDDELFIEMFSEIESIVIDGGKNKGLVISPKLVVELEKLTARVDGIINAIKNAKPGAMDGGAALLSTMIIGLESIQDKEDFSDIENKKIQH